MRIKRFKEFNEAISGTELFGPLGPGFHRPELSNKISSSGSNVILSGIDDEMYTEDDYKSLYQDYLKKGGSPLFGFNKENLEKVLVKLN